MSPWHLRQAAHTIHHGGIIAYPTEAVFGLGCDPLNPEAVFRLLDIKQRPVEKGLILIAANLDQLAPFIAPLSETDRKRLLATWPGPSTWLLPARPETPYWLTGSHDTIAVRVTAHPTASALCLAANHALVSTSANLSGRKPARSSLQARRQFGNQLDMILNGALGKEDRPTTIRDLSTDKLIRPG